MIDPILDSFNNGLGKIQRAFEAPVNPPDEEPLNYESGIWDEGKLDYEIVDDRFNLLSLKLYGITVHLNDYIITNGKKYVEVEGSLNDFEDLIYELARKEKYESE